MPDAPLNKRIDVGGHTNSPSRNQDNPIDPTDHFLFYDDGWLLAVAVDHTLWTLHFAHDWLSSAGIICSTCACDLGHQLEKQRRGARQASTALRRDLRASVTVRSAIPIF